MTLSRSCFNSQVYALGQANINLDYASSRLWLARIRDARTPELKPRPRPEGAIRYTRLSLLSRKPQVLLANSDRGNMIRARGIERKEILIIGQGTREIRDRGDGTVWQQGRGILSIEVRRSPNRGLTTAISGISGVERGSDLIGALPPKLFASCKLEDYGIATRLSLSLFRRSPSSSFASVFHPLLLPEIPDNATVLETRGPRVHASLARHSMCELRRLSLPSSSTYPRACKTLHKNEFDLNVDTD